MKKKTEHIVTLSIQEMEELIYKMKINQSKEPAMSQQVKVSLLFDTDYNSLRIDKDADGYQFSSYAECNGMPIIFEKP